MPTPTPASDSQATEIQMRRALGLQGPGRPAPQQRPDQARARHRFVQDGGVPVVVVNRADNDPTVPLKARIAELEAMLETERAAHGNTRRSLHEVQAASQALQTRLTHAELAHHDALAAERQVREAAETARQQLAARLAPLQEQVKAVRRRPAAVPRAEQEAQPVKWWLPNYKAKNA